MKDTKVICIGDSLTEGYEIDLNRNWCNLLSQDLNIEIVNCGISGDTTAGMLARFQTTVIAPNPSHVIIMGGTNDLWLGLPQEQILSNMLAMTRHARYHNIISIIGIPTVVYHEQVMQDKNSIFLGPKSLSDSIDEYRKGLLQFAIEDKLPYIDFALNLGPALFLEDGVHPNEKGHAQMKENAKSVLQRLLSA